VPSLCSLQKYAKFEYKIVQCLFSYAFNKSEVKENRAHIFRILELWDTIMVMFVILMPHSWIVL
jgi:hypothetical protein